MAWTLANTPPERLKIACCDCRGPFERTGGNHRRCERCAKAHYYERKRFYERQHDARKRRKNCLRCGEAFPEGTSGRFKYCRPECARVVRNGQIKVWSAAHPEQMREGAKRHRERHKERLAIARKTPEKRAKINEWQRRRLRNDAGLRVHANMSRLIHLALKGNKAGRRWETLVGFTRAELMAHLERQFTKGMTWETMGRKGWHIDHILPRKQFDIREAGDAEFRACWSLSNLRPLWHHHNLSKSAKRLHLI